MHFADQLRVGLQDLLASGLIEIRENGSRTTPLSPLSWEVRGASEKPLLHLWAENCNLTRRVVAITDQSQERLLLAVERFGRPAPERMEIVRLDFQRNPKQITREDFCEALRRILAENFPDESVEKISTGSDLEHSLSGVYVRGISRCGAVRSAFLAVPGMETQDAIESSLTYALLWLDRARQSSGKAPISALRLILPQGKARLLAHQLSALDSRLAIQLYELHSLNEHLERVDPCSNGNVDSWLIPHRESEALLACAQADLQPLIALAPDSISAHPSPGDQEVVLRFRGLSFARWCDGQICFGHRAPGKLLSPRTEPELKNLVLQLKKFRAPLTSHPLHPFYRAQAERWLQSLIAQDVSAIDVTLDPHCVYQQVVANSGSQHGVVDLLTITRSKRLALLELKATENPELPLQAAAYWSRIRQHQLQGDLERYGFFHRIQVHPAPPLVYLVAPALRFHPSTETLMRHLSPDIEIIRVGLAESWRRGLRVVMRQ